MPFSPPLLRGELYMTPRRLGCTAFNHCDFCFQCRAYDPYNALCVYCESRKEGKHCECSDKKVAAMKRLEEKLGRPYFNVNANPSTVERDEALMTTSFNLENQMIVQDLTEG